MTLVGVLHEIHLFPVKSVPGTSPSSAELGPHGLRGDRGFAVVDADGSVLAAKRHPALRDLALTGDPVRPRLTTPDGTALADFVGVAGARLAVVAGGARQVAPVHLVSTRQRLAPGAGDSSRANLVVEFGADEPDPDGLVGLRCSIGGVVLRLGDRPRHCAGLFAAVETDGVLRVGDEVRVGSPG
jgi:hypothetical protein